MKLAIIGSRTCPPVDIEAYLKYIPDTIVSGGTKGADTYAREFAEKKGLKLIEYFPNYALGWELYVNGATTEGAMYGGIGASETTSYWVIRKPCTKEEFEKAVEDGIR